MPNRLKSLFHNNDEEQLRAVAFHIQYVDKLHSELSSRLAKLPQQVYTAVLYIYFGKVLKKHIYLKNKTFVEEIQITILIV